MDYAKAKARLDEASTILKGVYGDLSEEKLTLLSEESNAHYLTNHAIETIHQATTSIERARRHAEAKKQKMMRDLL